MYVFHFAYRIQRAFVTTPARPKYIYYLLTYLCLHVQNTNFNHTTYSIYSIAYVMQMADFGPMPFTLLIKY